MQALLEGLRRREDTVRTVFAPLLEDIRRREEALRAAFAPLRDQLNRLGEAVRSISDDITKAVEQAAQARPGVVRYLLDRGWYPTYEFADSLLLRIDAHMRSRNHADADLLMSEFARTRLETVEASLRQRFPDRAQVFADAFEAHKGGKYTLSIPALLAQADGVGCEVLGIPRQFFRSRNRASGLQQKLRAFVLFGEPYVLTGVMQELLAPLKEESSIGADTEERDDRQQAEPWFGPLNRHGVLHGIDTDYHSEANSLRCVLLLRYLLAPPLSAGRGPTPSGAHSRGA